MPYKDPEAKRAYAAGRYFENRDKILAQNREWQRQNRDAVNATKRVWRSRPDVKEKENAAKRTPIAKERRSESARKRYAADPRAFRNSSLVRKYGITVEDWDLLFKAQGERCAICKRDSPNSKSGWSTDHCHDTGHVRGILCATCNNGIGHLRDNPGNLAAALRYLERHGKPLGTEDLFSLI